MKVIELIDSKIIGRAPNSNEEASPDAEGIADPRLNLSISSIGTRVPVILANQYQLP